VQENELMIAVSRLAAAALLVRNWPAKGTRHETALAIAGALVKAGWGEDDTASFVEIIARTGGSDDIPDKVKAVHSTVKRVQANQATTGVTALRRLISPPVATRLSEWLGLRQRPTVSADALCTDAANGQRLSEAHAENLAWVSTMKSWMVFDGTRWAGDAACRVQEACVTVSRNLYNEAIANHDGNARNDLLKWAKTSLSKPRLEAMEWAARPQLARSRSDFDSDPWLLNVGNGTIDLRTGTLKEHDAADLITRIVPVNYDPEATCPRWETFLDEVLNGDPELVSFFQKAVGYTLTGDVSEQCFFLLHGSGRNGKSVAVEVVQRVVGDYGRPIEMRALLQKRSVSEAVRNDLAALAGCRLAFAAEVNRTAAFDEALVKSLTGTDKITARFLFQEFFDFTPSFKLWLAVNHLPRITGTEEAIWRRVRLIPFNVTIPPARQERNLADQIWKEESSGILAWAVRGCMAWQEQNLHLPEVVRKAIEAYRATSDPMTAFLGATCANSTSISWRKPRGFVECRELYNSYQVWCLENGEAPMSIKEVGQALREHGYSVEQKWIDRRNCKVYVGLELLQMGERDPDACGGVGEQEF